MKSNYHISRELKNLLQNISCNFFDAKTSSKETVYSVAKENHEKNKLILSTCLRYEIYSFSKNNRHKGGFFYCKNITCIRRLLSILVGLQSEIIGEKEIFIQFKNSLKNSYSKKSISKDIYDGLENLLDIAMQIRLNTNLLLEENYSHIGARLVIEKAGIEAKKSKVVIIGGGYMSELFIKALDPTIGKIVWVNRDVRKIKEKIKNLPNSKKFKILSIQECHADIKSADFIFCAISNSENLFKDITLKRESMVIDISYPSVFVQPEDKTINFISLANTFFDTLVKYPISKQKIIEANKEIDYIIKMLSI